MHPFTFKKPRIQPVEEANQENRYSTSNIIASHSTRPPSESVDQNSRASMGIRHTSSTFSRYRIPLSEPNSMYSEPSYSQFCDGNFLNSTNALSEELFHSPTFDAIDSESDDGEEEEFLLEDDPCKPYLGKGRTVFCDNYFTSPNLAKTLINERTYLCGTLRAARKNAPPVPKLAKGSCEALACEEDGKTILVEYWRDKSFVRMLSTGISHGMVDIVSSTGIPRRKPVSVDDYNKNARGIDLADMAIQEYDTGRKTLKWYMKLFFRLLDLTIFNAFRKMKSQKGPLPFLTFRVNLVKQILLLTEVTPASVRPPRMVVDRINAPHYPVKFVKPHRCKIYSVNVSQIVFGVMCHGTQF